MIKKRLNDYESDWAAMPQVEKEKLEKLKNKTVLVCGHNIARSLCYALVFQSEEKKRGIRVIFAGDTDGFYPECTESEYFTSVNIDSLKELSSVDYIVHTGFCCEYGDKFSQAFADEIRRVNALAEVAARTKAKVVLLSDSRVYGKCRPSRVYAENEYSPLPPTEPELWDNQLLRTIESLWSCRKAEGGFSLTVLRTGVVLGGCCGLKTFLDDVFRAVAEGKPCTLVNGKKLSYIYLTDVFRAIVYVLGGTVKKDGAYNITGKDCTASAGAIAALLHDVYGDKAKITLIDGEDENACALTNAKIFYSGCEPALDLNLTIQLSVLPYMNDGKVPMISNIHDGRLEALQKMQIAYLREVDRICKKHNIKYYLGGGTLLGAIRHNGFIPWDDDSDIMMPREDYDKFAKVVVDELPEGMTFESHKTDKNCFYEFNKLRVQNTMFATELAKNHTDINVGIPFDIFAHDKSANSAWGRKLHLAMTVFTRALVLNKWNHRKVDNGSRLQSAVTNFFVKIFPLRFSFFLMEHTITFFKRKKNAKYLYDGTGKNVYNGFFDAGILNEETTHVFEGYEFPVPKRYDDYLKFIFGENYMEYPPLSTRIGCHEIVLMDLAKFDIDEFAPLPREGSASSENK